LTQSVHDGVDALTSIQTKDATTTTTTVEYNIKKFSVPRTELINDFKSEEKNLLTTIKDICDLENPFTETFEKFHRYCDERIEDIRAEKRGK